MLHSSTLLDFLVALGLLVALRALHDYRRRGGLPYPPGPRCLPVVGNLLDIPKETPWLKYAEYGQQYGDIICLRVFGKVIVILNSAKAVKDLFEKRSGIYSDRPANTMFEMMEWDLQLIVTRFGEKFHMTRNFVERGLRPGEIQKYKHMQQTRTCVLLNRILERPEEFEAHIDLSLQGELILTMTYGYEVRGNDDPKLWAAQEMNRIGLPALQHGKLLVNELSFLRYIPESLSWISYKPLARAGQDIWRQVRYAPIEFVKSGMVTGDAQPSLALQNLHELQKLDISERVEAEELIAHGLGSMYSAGAESTGSAIMTFLLAVLLNPAVQREAQAELDSVTARERLPTFEDRPLLPYTDAVCKEVLRWQPVTPLAVPHATVQDAVYEGYFIPKGAIIIGNTWALLQDPRVYPEPQQFKPERFLNLDGSLRDDPTLSVAFGFGKRICPARHFVDTTLFILVASLLSVFNIERKRDSEGNLLPVEPTYALDVIRCAYHCPGCEMFLEADQGRHSCPAQFPYRIVPRDGEAEDLLAAEVLAR
ncbi:cytochrome P450 [Gloeopeniophorella convolvens]|nr:cytochrome P450 [Gloeopeniophorella convolvens]